MKRNKILTGGIAALATVTLVSITAGSANADPVRPYAATGSDTIQDVWNGLTNDSTAVAPSIASFDAFEGDGTGHLVRTKTAGIWFSRPAGSGNGVKSLSAVWDTTNHTWSGKQLTHEEIDFARSSSGPSGSGSDLTYIPFARDAVSVAYNTTGALTGLDLTTNQIKELYTGVDDTSNAVVTFSAQPATSTTNVFITPGGVGSPIPVHPQIPQSGSGTRSFFLGAVGVTTLAPYIVDGTLAENNGNSIPNDGDLIPFSAAQFIAQRNAAAGVTNTTGALELAKVNGLVPFTGTTTLSPGNLFGTNVAGSYNTPPTPGVGTFNRDTFVVIPSAFSTGTGKQTNLVSILSGSGTGQLGSGGAKTLIRQYGFGTLGYISNSANYGHAPFSH